MEEAELVAAIPSSATMSTAEILVGRNSTETGEFSPKSSFNLAGPFQREIPWSGQARPVPSGNIVRRTA